VEFVIIKNPTTEQCVSSVIKSNRLPLPRSHHIKELTCICCTKYRYVISMRSALNFQNDDEKDEQTEKFKFTSLQAAKTL
jgi:hypothetical protein